MSEEKETTPTWTEADTEALFSALGKYLIIFQWIEGLLDQLLLLAWGRENWAASQKRLAGMTNAAKIEAVEAIVLNSSDFARVHTRPDWVAHFKTVIETLHTERKQRNTMVHSQILFEFAEKGLGPPLMSKRTKQDGADTSFDQHWLSRRFQQTMLGRIGALAVDMNFIYVQLLHDYRAQQ